MGLNRKEKKNLMSKLGAWVSKKRLEEEESGKEGSGEKYLAH